MIEEMQAKKARNDANNANMVKNLAEVASNTQDPTAKAIGTGVKAADKLTGGKASELLGKALTKNNKISPGGKMLQKASNKLAESGMGDRLTSAMNAKNNPTSKAATLKQMASKKGASNNMNSGSDSTPTNVKETEEQTSDGGLSNFDFSYKVIQKGLIAMIPISFVIVIICLFSASSNIFINSIGLDAADSTSSKEAEEKIGKLKDEEADREINDNNVNTTAYDTYISDEKSELFKQSKLKNYVQVAKKTYIERKYREVDLDNLHDFYPPLKTLNNDYDENLVYDFFFKMYNLNKTYKEKYGVLLDMPLLMSTLRIQSTDMNEVFSSNLGPEDRKRTARKMPVDEYDYYYDWSDYKVSKDNSEHDMEILAQRMVVVSDYVAAQSCDEPIDNKCYKVDTDKYKEFLKEFLEKKYFVKGESSLSQNEITQNSTNSEKSSMAEVMVSIANQEYILNNGKKGGKKYWSAAGYNSRIEWCVTFAWYVASQTEYNGIKLYPNIITHKSASTGSYMKYFNSSINPNVNFYYNDSCSNLKGKNGTINYTPKPGDFIFFDWAASFYDLNASFGKQDHTGIVEKYEDGVVYTIEGNINNTVIKRSFKINNCQIIGFGSWY